MILKKSFDGGEERICEMMTGLSARFWKYRTVLCATPVWLNSDEGKVAKK